MKKTLSAYTMPFKMQGSAKRKKERSSMMDGWIEMPSGSRFVRDEESWDENEGRD